jgi:hypothetical protein
MHTDIKTSPGRVIIINRYGFMIRTFAAIFSLSSIRAVVELCSTAQTQNPGAVLLIVLILFASMASIWTAFGADTVTIDTQKRSIQSAKILTSKIKRARVYRLDEFEELFICRFKKRTWIRFRGQKQLDINFYNPEKALNAFAHLLSQQTGISWTPESGPHHAVARAQP